jgi:hypothetical protein
MIRTKLCKVVELATKFAASFTMLLGCMIFSEPAFAAGINVKLCLDSSSEEYFTAEEILIGKRVADPTWNVTTQNIGQYDIQIPGAPVAKLVGFAINSKMYVPTVYTCRSVQAGKPVQWTITYHQPRTSECPPLTEEKYGSEAASGGTLWKRDSDRGFARDRAFAVSAREITNLKLMNSAALAIHFTDKVNAKNEKAPLPPELEVSYQADFYFRDQGNHRCRKN